MNKILTDICNMYWKTVCSLEWLSPVSLLMFRVWVAVDFFRAGLVKVSDMDSTISLFTNVYHVPLLAPVVAAYLGTGVELILPWFLGLGLAGRPTGLRMLLQNKICRMKTLFIGLTSASLLASAATAAAPATFIGPCRCIHCMGHDRWKEKIDDRTPPANPTPESPSDIAAWKGPGAKIARSGRTEHRLPEELKWYQVTGRVVLVRVEADGDLHIQLMDASATNSKMTQEIVVEVPSNTEVHASTPWCSIRKTVFSWSTQTFPFTTSDKPLTLKKHPVITVVGEAFYDTDHAPKGNKANSRPTQKYVSVWEIHPVMELRLIR
ncbi:MAG: DoxX family protein [Gammaproteobacteria bacterium]|nr:DoxX family protein [Gammaproteobacteria bacterium]